MRNSGLPDGVKVLVGVSGGPSSRAMIHALSAFHSVDNPRKKQKLKDVVVCYVDMAGVVGCEESCEPAIRAMVESYGFTYICTKLEDAFGREGEEVVPIDGQSDDPQSLLMRIQKDASESNTDKLRRCVAAFGKMSSKEDVLHYLTLQALLRAAREHGCGALMLGDNSTRVAIRVISQISKGRGFAMPIEVATGARWYEDVIVLRPFRDILSKEIGLYNEYENLTSVHVPTLTTGMPARSSIDRLTEEFIVGLDRDFPSTVSTITRTAFKAGTKWDEEGVGRCPLCGG
ncbi:Cytoplasmic tRNA 2-thiolation protein 2 [Borealophlyctis nickersoniae]|nr:Cytoplasmic tRNA 2-thiolation protein 2 [Borealophlyctis nickersoniae]